MWFTMFVVPREYQEKPKHVQLVWLDLKLVKHWNDVRIEELQGIPLVVGKPNPQDEEQIIIPVLASETISMERYASISSLIVHFLGESFQCDKINFETILFVKAAKLVP
jgi:hypothetical protein